MLRPLVCMAFYLLTVAAHAATIQKSPHEAIQDFAKRNAPNSASEVVHVISASVWNLDKPVIISFYRYPISNADKAKNYGDFPNKSEVLGVIFMPVNSNEYRKYEIDSYGPVAGDAEINSVFFAKTEAASDKSLFVMVKWHGKHGVLYSTYIYEKPNLNTSKNKLVYLEKMSEVFKMECDYCPTSNHPGWPAKFKTAAEVKAELNFKHSHSPLLFRKQGNTLCITDEVVLFSCNTNTGSRIISLCGSMKPNGPTSYIQYRYGSQNQLELVYPATKKPPGQIFTTRYDNYTRGGRASSVSFNIGKYSYVISAGLISGSEDNDGHVGYVSDAGLEVYRQEKSIKNIPCNENDYTGDYADFAAVMAPYLSESLSVPTTP